MDNIKTRILEELSRLGITVTADLDILYILTGQRIEDIIRPDCRNCRHYWDCDPLTCDEDCDSCAHNQCRNCANYSNWLWEGYTNAEK